jgi:hypothetical protein
VDLGEGDGARLERLVLDYAKARHERICLARGIRVLVVTHESRI